MRHGRALSAAVLLVLWGVLAALTVPLPPPGELQCTFIAVGHGSAALLELPGGRTLLYDAGRLGPSQIAGRLLCDVLWERGLRRIDDVVISHADVDHFNALPLLLERFSIGAIHAPQALLDSREPSVEALLDAVAAAGVPIEPIDAGTRLDEAEAVEIRVLHPPAGSMTSPAARGESDNASSVVLLVVAHQRRILLSGDLEGAGLERLTAGEPLPCDVVLAPHHGSPRSNTSQWAAWCRPQWAIVSSGRANRQQLEAVYESVGARVLLTEEHGAITVVVDPDGYRVDWFRK